MEKNKSLYANAELPEIADYLRAIGQLNYCYLHSMEEDGVFNDGLSSVGIVIEQNLEELASRLEAIGEEQRKTRRHSIDD